MNYRLAKESDMDNLIDFINMVFSMLRVPHNFEAMLPKVYGPAHRLADIHVLAEDEQGRLCGCLGMYVFPLRVAGTTLRVGYLGSMAVHSRARGHGAMGTLMQKQIDRGMELGLDVMVLGGQRQRYQYSGFETGGVTICYSISKANVRHAMAGEDASGLSFREMRQEDVAYALSLYNGQIVAGARTETNFIDSLRSYGRNAWVIEKDGAVVGYLSASADGKDIGEIVICDEGLILPAIKAWVSEKDIRLLHVDAAPYDVTLNRLLSPICENFSLSPNCMIRVLRPETVLRAYMTLKNACDPLEAGELTIGWEGLGAYKLSVGGEGISVEATQAQPDVSLSGIDVHQLLFGYNRFAAPDVKAKIPAGWFPLPLHIPHPDSF